MRNKRLLGKLAALLKPYKKQIVYIFICLLISAVFNLLLPLVTRNIMDKGLMGKDYQLLLASTTAMLTLYILDTLAKILEEKYRIYMENDLQKKLGMQAFEHLMRLKISYYETQNHSEILQNTVTDINTISRIANSEIFFSITQILSFIRGITGLFIIN